MIRRKTNIKTDSIAEQKKFNVNEKAMSLVRANGEESVVKKKKVNDKTNNNVDEIEELVASEIDEQCPDIYKLPVELMTEVFNFLTVGDLSSVCQTSKWWQSMAHACYQQNYLFLNVYYQGKTPIGGLDSKLDAFKQSIRRMAFSKTNELKHFLDTESKFHQLRDIVLVSVNLAEIKIDSMKTFFSKLERISLVGCKMKPNFVEHIIDMSPNLKHFNLKDHSWGIGSEWPLCKYHSTLERVSIIQNEVLPIAIFLTLNPNIRYFGINSTNLWENRDSLKISKLTLDDLAVDVDFKEWPKGNLIDHTKTTMFASICRFLNELHELGIYKRLRLYIRLGFKQEMVDKIASLNGLFELYIYYNSEWSHALSTLRDLEEFHCQYCCDINDIDAMASNLVNLKLLHIREADAESIMPFIKRSANLETIKISERFYHEDMNLAAMNKERSKLPNAKKITLLIPDKCFVAERAHQEIDLDFIKLQRKASFNWDSYFCETFG